MLHLFSQKNPQAASINPAKISQKPFLILGAFLVSLTSSSILQASNSLVLEEGIAPVKFKKGCHENANNTLDNIEALRASLIRTTTEIKIPGKDSIYFDSRDNKGYYLRDGKKNGNTYTHSERLKLLRNLFKTRTDIINTYFGIFTFDFLTQISQATQKAYAQRPYETVETIKASVAKKLADATLATREEKLLASIKAEIDTALETFISSTSTLDHNSFPIESVTDESIMTPQMLHVDYLSRGKNSHKDACGHCKDSEFEFHAFRAIFGDLLYDVDKIKEQMASLDKFSLSVKFKGKRDKSEMDTLKAMKIGLTYFTQQFFLDRSVLDSKLPQAFADFNEAQRALFRTGFFGKPGRFDLTYADKTFLTEELGYVEPAVAIVASDNGKSEESAE